MLFHLTAEEPRV